MWKKDETPAPKPATQPEAAAPRPDRPAPAARSAERATIGRSITIKGEVTGDEDLLIQGRVDGSVDLKQHSVTVGAEGDVKASIIGRVVTVEGRVEGDITADEQAILRSAARVQGDISAPRVVLEDGARFRGGIDMGNLDEPKPSIFATQPQATRTPEPAREKPAAAEGSGDRAKGGINTPAEVAS